MVNQAEIDAIKEQIRGLESIRDRFLKDGVVGGNLAPIFDAIDELYRKLLKEIGYTGDIG